MGHEASPRKKVPITVSEDTVEGYEESAAYAREQAESIERTRGEVRGRDDDASIRAWNEYELALRQAAAKKVEHTQEIAA